MLLASVRTQVGYWDTADLQTVAWIAGIPYPTGFPGYVLLGWLWTHALPIGSAAARLNALSAVAIASAAAIVTWLALLFETIPAIAVLAGWLFAFSEVVWFRGTYADVHPVGFAVAFVAVALAVRWSLRGETRDLGTAIVLAGAAVAVDNTTTLILVGAVVASLGRRWPVRVALRSCAAAVLIVAAAYAYLPARSAYVTAHRIDPTLSLGIAPGRPFWDDHHPATPARLRWVVTGADWNPDRTVQRLFAPPQLERAVQRFGDELADDEPQGLLFAALFGLCVVFARARLAATGLLLAAIVPALFGASYPVEADPERYAFMLYAVTALGIAVAADRTIRAFGRERPGLALAVVGGALALAVVRDLARGQPLFQVRGSDEALAFTQRVVKDTRDGAIIVAPWNTATALGYRAYVDHALGRRIVVCGDREDFSKLYRGWMRQHQLVFVAEREPRLPGYRSRLISDGSPQVFEILPR